MFYPSFLPLHRNKKEAVVGERLIRIFWKISVGKGLLRAGGADAKEKLPSLLHRNTFSLVQFSRIKRALVWRTLITRIIAVVVVVLQRN